MNEFRTSVIGVSGTLASVGLADLATAGSIAASLATTVFMAVQIVRMFRGSRKDRE